ncbi:hypothetical protein [Dubosiella newyorkensis]|uniref:hypothetical protein n=1 Tax=Dubosiella newyorkensis TaxID=1862672 RepID=UPI0024BB0621|nr:hypothetical protein [Dubosiella newyorkensis]
MKQSKYKVDVVEYNSGKRITTLEFMEMPITFTNKGKTLIIEFENQKPIKMLFEKVIRLEHQQYFDGSKWQNTIIDH